MKGNSEFKKRMIADKAIAQKKTQEAAKKAKAEEAAKYQAVIDLSYDERHKLINNAVKATGFNPYSNSRIKTLRKALENKYFDIVDIKVWNGAFCTTELVINVWVWNGDYNADMTETHTFDFG